MRKRDLYNSTHVVLQRVLLSLLFLLFVSAVQAADRPKVALIIDDMGNHLNLGLRAVMLPGAINYAFLPHTPYVSVLAELAHSKNKLVMLHQPLESHGGNRLGPGGLTLHLDQPTFNEILLENIAVIPHIQGVNNHMGSLMTRHPGAMQWLMDVLGEVGLFFVDSRTTEKSVAYGVAEESSIAIAGRDIFLDHDRDVATIRRQLKKLLQIAKLRGSAIGIGHPYPETLQVLEEELPNLSKQGFELVLVSELTKIEFGQRLWRVSTSPLSTIVRNTHHEEEP
ncbi:MAG: divergent polysaccharide deacetylase family protein [Candidatus Polarisedimenticolaceae bacterium]|nr:divergent polysaccharide deacetylase family protein [Candidatus Polarisedimenticolaceae bacterium]